jgi:hypothetical protein
MARFLIVLGLVILAIGLLWPYLSQVGWAAARRHRHRAGKYDVLFPADDMFALERAAQPGLLGREPLNGESGHRAGCRAPRAVLPGDEAARERFGAGVTLWASNIPCRCAAAFSMSWC